MNAAQIARIIDHTQLRAYATEVDIRELCQEALQYGFATVTVNPAWVSFCAKAVAGSGTGVSACVGFPLGANTASIKLAEARECVRNGGTELDMVLNIGALKSGYPQYAGREIAAIVQEVKGVPVKVIIETGFLNEAEKETACRLCVQAGAAYVKTCTGYGEGAATVDDIAFIRSIVGDHCGIKAAGGIRSYADVMALIEAGATRIGTSAGVAIVEEAG